MTLACRDIQTHSATAERHIARGEAMLGRGEHEAALAVADQVLANDPEFASAWLLRGTACRALHRFAEAAEAYRFLLDLFPDFAQMRVNLANACIELEDFGQAEEQLREAIMCNPDFAVAHTSLGSLYMRMDRYDLAEAPTRKALACDPTIAIAHRNLAAILALRGDPEAEAHRDAAYRRQQLFCEYSPGARQTALILTASGSGNVPYAHLLPRARYNRILWHLAYAPPGQADDLPPHDFIFNAVGDPDAADLAQRAAERFVEGCALPVINRPDRVARTRRSGMPALLGSLPEIRVPNTIRIERSAGDPAAAILASGLAFPLILRPVGRHGGEGAQLVRSQGDLAGRIPGCESFYATEFVNYRSPDGWYRKYRVIFVDRKPYPYHLAIGARWLLHYRTADMTADAARRIEELDFLRDPAAALGPSAMTALRRIGAQLDLDYAGIDFSLLPDGRLLFFEANPTMLVHPEDDPLFAYKNAAVDAILAAMNAMIARPAIVRPTSPLRRN
jgi:Flp pilus assembly protein TadD/glutathione synthase/RimK-type ligase-like ATP-grasp enzyme